MAITLPRRPAAKLEHDARDGRRPSRSAAIATALEEPDARRADQAVREETVRYHQG